MTKNQLIKEIAKNSDLTQAQVKKALGAFSETIVDKLAQGEKIIISGLGTFILSKRKSRTGINLKTGQKIQFPPTVIPRFRVSQKLKQQIR